MNSLEEPSIKPLDILLVEDDDGDAKALRRAFKRANIPDHIVRAVDGIEALEMLKGENGKTKLTSPRILLADLNMPRMNGIEFVKALRADEELRRSIVFVLTTSKRDEDRIAAYDLNVAGYINKATSSDFIDLADLMYLYSEIVELP